MPAERLYYDDSYLRTFEARVTAQRTVNDRPAVALDRTAFYPEGGGQPGDYGMLNGITVIDTQADDVGEVWHVLAAPLDADTVTAEIDWTRRFDLMQQHHGQHLLSAAFEQLFGARTLSVHMGEAMCTVDLEHPPFTGKQIAEVETLVNHMVWANVEIYARFVTPDELQMIPLRKPPKVHERIRVVSAGNFDHSACGGTHPQRTGEVGCVVIRRWERYKAGTRVEFVCGGRAVRDYAMRRDLLQQLAATLHVGLAELPDTVARLQASEAQGRKALEAAQTRLTVYDAQELLAAAERIDGVPVVVHTFADRSIASLRLLARHIAEGGGVALLGLHADKAQFIFIRGANVPFDMREALAAATAIVGGRGGGKPESAQGGGPDTDRLDEALQAAVKTLTRSNVEKLEG
jgi:alanyl-tRNA synthetase